MLALSPAVFGLTCLWYIVRLTTDQIEQTYARGER